MLSRLFLLAATATLVGATATLAQTPQVASATPPGTQSTPAKAPDFLSIYFDSGSSGISAQGQSVLDKAARTYRDGKPIIMVVSGASDSTGSAAGNLHLSQTRADNVLQGLVARGIPVEHFQVLAKGETEPAVPAPEGTAEARNRRVEISWR
ncbi:MAG: OmpA family protein [Pseudomonadota bacterium]|nr:OmpA family protein [Pseudomonadota bacterium]